MNSVQKKSRLSPGAAIVLIASVLAAIPAGPASSETPIRQYVCEIDNGPLAGQVVLITAPTSPGAGNPCGEAPAPDGSVRNTGRVVFEHSAGLLQYVCDPGAGPLMLLSRATPPGLGEPCDDGAGAAGVVVFVEAPG